MSSRTRFRKRGGEHRRCPFGGRAELGHANGPADAAEHRQGVPRRARPNPPDPQRTRRTQRRRRPHPRGV
ncbi:MAG: hypothetical protein N3A68_08675 [Bacteroidia bacterium]|nr:hypothetical protein [Bacteroidia bacterium]